MFRNKAIEYKDYFVKQAIEMMVKKLQVGLLPETFEKLMNSLISGEGNSTALNTADRFWAQAINDAAEREQAIELAISNFYSHKQVLKKVAHFQRVLEQEFTTVHKSSAACSVKLSQLLRISKYGLKLIRSTRKSYKFNEQLQSLLKAATTLSRIKKLPTFTMSLSTFAESALKMGLSRSSTQTAIQNLLVSVYRVIEKEFDRLAEVFEARLAAKSVNARFETALEKLTAPCNRLGLIASDAVRSACIVNSYGTSDQEGFVPILQRMAAVGLVILLLISLYSLLCLIYICITKSLSSKKSD